jgi:hypothetical protein
MREAGTVHHFMNQRLSNLVRSLWEQDSKVNQNLTSTNRRARVNIWPGFDAMCNRTAVSLHKARPLLRLKISTTTGAMNREAVTLQEHGPWGRRDCWVESKAAEDVEGVSQHISLFDSSLENEYRSVH